MNVFDLLIKQIKTTIVMLSVVRLEICEFEGRFDVCIVLMSSDFE